MEWFRWYHGTTTDPKLALIAHLSGEPTHLVLAVWASLLEVASTSHPRGDISSFDPECHAVTLQALQKQIVTILDFMTQKGMIENGSISKWGKRQFGSESLERVRKYRENNKNKNVTDVTVTPCNVTSVTSVNVTPEEKRIKKHIQASQTSEEFEKFWSVCPTRAKRCGRAEAEKAWNKNVNGNAAEVIASMQSQSQSPDWLKDNGQFTPMASTWLNQKRWTATTESMPLLSKRYF